MKTRRSGKRTEKKDRDLCICGYVFMGRKCKAIRKKAMAEEERRK